MQNRIIFKNLLPLVVIIMVVSAVLLFSVNNKSINMATEDNPNIVIISVDAMAANHLGIYGGNSSISQNIDALSKSSIIFEKAYTTVPWTNGSYASLFTGNYFNKFFTGEKIDKNVTTLAEIMNDNGYKTGGFYSTPNLRDSMNGLGKGFEKYIEGDDTKIIDPNFNTSLLTSKNLRDLNTKNNSVEWIKKNQNEKFFMFTHLFAPHMPYDAPEEFKSKNIIDSKIDYAKIDNLLKDNKSPDLNSYNFSPEELNYLKEKYNEEIRFADYCVGQIISEIKNQKIEDRTIVIITADHGESFDHDYLHHTQRLYESSIKVPLIYSDPRYKSGAKVQEPVSLIDIFPTLTKRVGININYQVDGEDLLPEINGKSLKRQAIFAMSMPAYLPEGKDKNVQYMNNNKYLGQQYIAINSNQRFIYNINSGKKEIYNINEDPEQLNNLITDSKYQEEAPDEELYTRLILWLQKTTNNNNGNLKLQNEELYNSMKSLGYL